MSRRAVFLDRDGTLVHPRHYPSRPDELQLYEGVAPELRRLQEAGFLLIVITNQGGIARGYFTEDALGPMHDHLRAELARGGVYLDGIYYCPHHPEGIVEGLRGSCECRKPRPGMIVRAAQDHDIDTRTSWFIGDILDDVEAGNRARCRTILVDLGTEAEPDDAMRIPEFVARDTVHALQIVRASEGREPMAGTEYRPAGWSSRTLEEQPA